MGGRASLISQTWGRTSFPWLYAVAAQISPLPCFLLEFEGGEGKHAMSWPWEPIPTQELDGDSKVNLVTEQALLKDSADLK